jgi:hypothetical protein
MTLDHTFAEWSKRIATAPADAKFEVFKQAAFDIGQRVVGVDIDKPDAIDRLIDMAHANGFDTTRAENVIGDQFERGGHERNNDIDWDKLDEQARARPRDPFEDLREAWREQRERWANGKDGAAAAGGLDEWNAAEDIDPPPPRAWLLGNVFARTFLSSIIGSGGVGKTALRYAQALSLATGRELTGEHVFQRCRVLIISLEDDANELRRRIRAVRLHYNIPLSELDGWLFLAAPGAKAGKLMVTNNRGRVVPGNLGAKIETAVIAHNIDLVMLDPFVKSHSVEENLNSAIDDVTQQLTDLATKHNIAADTPHHVRKGLMTPGDADSGRGASAMGNAARLVYTCVPMSPEEAQAFNISEADRRSYIRVDSGKVNIAKSAGSAKWFRLIGVPLDNATELYPSGDEVQTVEPWSPPDAWAGTTHLGLNAVLNDIDRGLTDEDGKPTGRRYSNAPNAKDRAVWPVVQKHYPDKTEAQCRTIIHAWLDTGLLYPEDYDDPVDRKARKGLKVDSSKRPS